MPSFDSAALKSAARQAVGEFRSSADCIAGGVAAALVTASGSIHSGICIDTDCSLGFCAEHAAIADMLKSRQSRIVAIVAVGTGGEILAPCGRCRELIRQVDPENWNTVVLVAEGVEVTLADLMPFSTASEGAEIAVAPSGRLPAT